jgi:hypothetical protein
MIERIGVIFFSEFLVSFFILCAQKAYVHMICSQKRNTSGKKNSEHNILYSEIGGHVLTPNFGTSMC